jgi:hypothetical protein
LRVDLLCAITPAPLALYRELTEQAAAYSGAAHESRMADRIAALEIQLAKLLNWS